MSFFFCSSGDKSSSTSNTASLRVSIGFSISFFKYANISFTFWTTLSNISVNLKLSKAFSTPLNPNFPAIHETRDFIRSNGIMKIPLITESKPSIIPSNVFFSIPRLSSSPFSENPLINPLTKSKIANRGSRTLAAIPFIKGRTFSNIPLRGANVFAIPENPPRVPKALLKNAPILLKKLPTLLRKFFTGSRRGAICFPIRIKGSPSVMIAVFIPAMAFTIVLPTFFKVSIGDCNAFKILPKKSAIDLIAPVNLPSVLYESPFKNCPVNLLVHTSPIALKTLPILVPIFATPAIHLARNTVRIYLSSSLAHNVNAASAPNNKSLIPNSGFSISPSTLPLAAPTWVSSAPASFRRAN